MTRRKQKNKNSRIKEKQFMIISGFLVALFLSLYIAQFFAMVQIDTVWQVNTHQNKIEIYNHKNDQSYIFSEKHPLTNGRFGWGENVFDPDGDYTDERIQVNRDTHIDDAEKAHTLPTIKTVLSKSFRHIDKYGHELKENTPTDTVESSNGTIYIFSYEFDIGVRVAQADWHKVTFIIPTSTGSYEYNTIWKEDAMFDLTLYVGIYFNKSIFESNITAYLGGVEITKVDNHIVNGSDPSQKFDFNEFNAFVKTNWDTQSVTPFLQSPQEGQKLNTYREDYSSDYFAYLFELNYIMRAGFEHIVQGWWLWTQETYNTYYPESIVTLKVDLVTFHPKAPVVSDPENSTLKPSQDLNFQFQSKDPVGDAAYDIGNALYDAGAFFAAPSNQNFIMITLGLIAVIVIVIKLKRRK